MPDGTVRVRACGSEESIQQLVAWLHQGPPMAAVSGVEEAAAVCTAPDRFTTGRAS
jgi:acylphosphatase